MPSLKDWLTNDSDTLPPLPLDAEDVTVDRWQMRSLLSSQAAPEAVTVQDLTPLQMAPAPTSAAATVPARFTSLSNPAFLCRAWPARWG
jgi:hypothetical protein